MKYQKSISAPKTFPVKKKGRKYVTNPSPGPHPKSECIPLGVILRDVLSYADTLKEARKILNNENILIDGKVKKDYRYPVGIFDVIDFPKIEKCLRVVPSKKGFKLIEIGESEKNKKLCKIKDKKPYKGGKIQFNLNDGKNIFNAEGSPNDSLLLNLEDMKSEGKFERKKGNLALITRGKNRGKLGKIKGIETVKGSGPNRVVIELEDNELDVPEDMVFIVGKDKPVITVVE